MATAHGKQTPNLDGYIDSAIENPRNSTSHEKDQKTFDAEKIKSRAMTEQRRTFQTATTEIVNMQQTGIITAYDAAVRLNDALDHVLQENLEEEKDDDNDLIVLRKQLKSLESVPKPTD